MNWIVWKTYGTVCKILEVKEKGQKPWISRNSWKLVEERKHLKQQIINSRSERVKRKLKSKYSEKDKEIKCSVRNDRRKWTDDLMNEAERAASNGHMRTVYEVTRVLCKERRSTGNVVKDKDGRVLSSQEERKKRWKEHFEEVLNRPQPSHPLEIDDEGDTVEEIDIEPKQKDEIIKAKKKLKNGKSGGIDGITAEIMNMMKADMETTIKYLEKLFTAIWNKEVIPPEWNKGLIVKIPKKGDRSVCDNNRSITLLSVPSKIQRIQEGVKTAARRASRLQERKKYYRTTIYTQKYHRTVHRVECNIVCELC
ncbi:hypothetical protein FSP39_008513 [Pinctada imbricata]|uniref:Endonuclease-reverse transcriptase n=1 Tax=Pinctada imbricata TaxID=66713 RepID=A0AA89BWJ4_PINIB|nr:hypothetical protein FSP39_008513 [Pinctada imbricata]